MRSFGSDNYAGAHKSVVQAVAIASTSHAKPYGNDDITEAAAAMLKHAFGVETEPLFVFNGTAANVLAIATMTRSHEGVICPETAHINVDECGAPETVGHLKLLPVPHENGKLTVEAAKKHLSAKGVVHHTQPKVLSISNVTEYGTVYSVDETRALADFAHENDMLLHIDGARLSGAAASLDVSLDELTFGAGADAVSFGGTKNGMLFGEAVLFRDAGHAEAAAYNRKRMMQLGSKMRIISAQFIAMMNNDLWKTSAAHANAMARRLANAIDGIQGVRITRKVEANAVFAVMPKHVIEPLSAEFPFYVWDESVNEVRLMCSFDTIADEVDVFAEKLRELADA